MTQFAQGLIRALREDTTVRQHFDMGSWWAGSCNTVGCIAGTALLMTGLNQDAVIDACNSDYYGYGDKKNRAGELLGLPYPTARHLFLPGIWARDLREGLYEQRYYWSGNQIVDLSTVEKMKDYAHSFDNIDHIYRNIGPDEAATALENCLEQPHYMDWARVLA